MPIAVVNRPKVVPGHGAAPCPPVSETDVLLLDDPGVEGIDLEKSRKGINRALPLSYLPDGRAGFEPATTGLPCEVAPSSLPDQRVMKS